MCLSSFGTPVVLHHVAKYLLQDTRTAPSPVPVLVVCAYPTPVELQVTPQKLLSHTPL